MCRVLSNTRLDDFHGPYGHMRGKGLAGLLTDELEARQGVSFSQESHTACYPPNL